MKKIILILLVIIVTLAISFFVTMWLNSYNLFIVNMPKQIPYGFNRISTVKKMSPEGNWLFISIFENSHKQQIFYNVEPHRVVNCKVEERQQVMSAFRPSGSSEGCSSYKENLINEKKVKLHSVIWNKEDFTYAIYDLESVLIDQDVLGMAESIGSEILIAKDFTKKNE